EVHPDGRAAGPVVRRVRSGAAVHLVGAASTVESVAAAAAGQHVVSGSAVDRVAGSVSGQVVRARPPDQVLDVGADVVELARASVVGHAVVVDRYAGRVV